jgi:hypothetical protein
MAKIEMKKESKKNEMKISIMAAKAAMKRKKREMKKWKWPAKMASAKASRSGESGCNQAKSKRKARSALRMAAGNGAIRQQYRQA